MPASQLQQRLIVGGLSTLLIFFSIFFSFHPLFKPAFISLISILILVALSEFYHLCQLKGFLPSKKWGMLFSLCYIGAVIFSLSFPQWTNVSELVLMGGILALFISFFPFPQQSIGNISVTIFGILYLTLPLCCILRINYFFPPDSIQDGRIWLAYLLLVSKSADVGGYFIGKWKGKTLLSPVISPKKTVEGAIAGFTFSLITSLLFGLFSSSNPEKASFSLTIWQSIWLGGMISLLAQVSDLTESLFKRDAGVKDSSYIPGLGGILDMVDSLLFTLPLMYLLLKMHLLN